MTAQRLNTVMALQALVMRLGLPKMDYALFGIKCPYCGKMDRICMLDPPGEAQQTMDDEDAGEYARTWSVISQPGCSIGVCKFCNNLLNLNNTTNAEPLADEHPDGHTDIS